jgi:hypothetical protein
MGGICKRGYVKWMLQSGALFLLKIYVTTHRKKEGKMMLISLSEP